MNQKEFINYLNEKNISYKLENNTVIINHKGYVYLDNLKEIKTDVVFENKGNVNLYNLKEIKTDIVFNNKGYVYLDNLKEINTDIVFNNKGYVYLDNLKEINTDVVFNNKGFVDLVNLKEINTDVVFNNKGYVDLNNLKEITHQGKVYKLKMLDNYTMLILSEKTKGKYQISKCSYFKGLPIKEMKKSYVVKKGKYESHGKTIKEAIEDVEYKYQQENFNLDSLVKKVKKENKIYINDYRLLTGACRFGIDKFINDNNIKKKYLTIKETLKLTKNDFGHGKIKELFT
jgi:hypothetical protein